MTRIPRFVMVPVILTVVLALVPAASARDARERIERSLALLPADLEALVLVPGLNHTGDEVAACLEGMEKSALLLGSRPVDQVKSATGLLRSVNDLGPVIVAWTRTAVDAGAAPGPCAIVPVNDAAVFLDVNFDEDPTPGAWLHPSGRRLFARVFVDRVVLSPDAWVLDYEPTGPVDLDQARLVTPDGDLVVYARRTALARMLDAAGATALGRAAPAGLGALQTAASRTDDLTMSIDFDPLGVIVRTRVRPGWTGARRPVPGRGEDRLARLARRPALVAGAVDRTARAPLAAADRPRGDAPASAWAVVVPPPAIRGLAFAARPDASGSLLGAVEVHIETSDRAAARSWLGGLLAALERDDAALRRTVTWRPLNDARGLPSRTAFTVTTVPLAPEAAVPAMIETGLFGRRGLGGVVGNEDGGVLVVLGGDAAWRTAYAAPDAGAGLDSDGAVRTIRGWLPAQRDVEIYVDPRLLLEKIAPVAPLLAAAGVVLPPPPDDALPPVGYGAALDPDESEAVLVVPAPVAALVLDGVLEFLSRAARAGEPEADGSP